MKGACLYISPEISLGPGALRGLSLRRALSKSCIVKGASIEGRFGWGREPEQEGREENTKFCGLSSQQMF